MFVNAVGRMAADYIFVEHIQCNTFVAVVINMHSSIL